MAWMTGPGVVKKEISKFRTSLRTVRGVCLHVAVSEADSLYGFFSGARVCSHFYVRRDGTIEQYVDTRFQAPANLEGNSSLVSVETEGGVTNANSEPWTAAQREALARICAFANEKHGVPLQVMPNSRKTSRGIGYHRLGVDPYRVSGGEKWSNAYGKICPGQGKINQIPSIVARAKELVAGSDELPDTGNPEQDWFDMANVNDLVAACRTAVFSLLKEASARDTATGRQVGDFLTDILTENARVTLHGLLDEAANRSTATGRQVADDLMAIVRAANKETI